MAPTEKKFGQKLAGMEQATAALKEKFDREIRAMTEQKLTKARKVAWVASGILGLGFLGLFGTVAVIAPAEFPLLGRLGFGAGAAFGLVWAGFCLWVIRRDSFDRRKVAVASAGIAWGATVIMTTLMLLLSGQHPDKAVGTQMVVVSLVFLVMAAMFMIVARVKTAELNTREKLLEIEYRLAELSEKIGQGE
jgi:hypothetical protein